MNRIFITGANGLVGKNLVQDSFFSGVKLFSPSSKELNLLEFDQVLTYIQDIRPEFIVHCAGRVGGIKANIAAPYDFFYENIEMGKNIIRACKEVGGIKVLNLGSSCIYPRNIDGLLHESLILKGELEPTNEGYAMAKLAVLRMGQYFNQQFNLRLVKTIIPCNLYGEYDKFDEHSAHLLPSVIRKVDNAIIQNLSEVEIWGTGEAKREFMYIKDLIRFIVHAIKNFDDMPDLLNVGLAQDYTINEYYKIVSDVLGYEGKFSHNLNYPSGMKRKVVDNSLALQFGWKPIYSVEDGIKRTYKYYVDNIRGK